MSLTRIGATVALAVVGGCSLLTGVGDLSTDPAIHGSSAKPDSATPGDEDGATSSGGPMDGAIDDATTTPDGTEDAALPPGRVRQITFENGTLTGLHGADEVVGLPTFATGPAALRGAFSMNTSVGKTYVSAVFMPLAELYATLVVHVTVLPKNDAHIGQLSFSGSSNTVDLVVSDKGDLSGALGGTSAGIGKILAGETKRLGFHVKANGGTTTVEAYLAADNQPFGAAQATQGLPGLGSVSRIAMGAVNDVAISATFDDLLVDTLAMPAP